MRAFIALELGRECVDEIIKIQKLLKKRVLFNGKYTESENLHLTLKFLGEIDEEKVSEVKKKLSEIKNQEFDVELGEIGVFSKDFIRIIWIKLNGKGIFHLQKEIDEKLSVSQTFALGGKASGDEKLSDLFSKEDRFMSHITIARVKTIGDPEKDSFSVPKNFKKEKQKFSGKKGLIEYLGSIKPRKIKFRVNEFILKKSELRPEGPVYEDLEKYKLIKN